MKGLTKFAAILAVIIIVLIAATFILLKTLVTPERIKQTVLPLAEKSLHRSVTLDDVEISILSGINLKGIRIMDASGSKPFVSCAGVRLHYELMPLLQGRVQVKEISLIKPEIHITRNSDGSFNFSDILKQPAPEKTTGAVEPAKPAVSKKQPPPGPQENSPGSSDSSLSIMVSSISISDGRIIFTDKAAPGNRTVETSMSDVNMKISDFSMNAPFPVKFSAMLNKGGIEADGTVGIKGPAGEMNIQVKALGVTDFSPYFAASLPGKLKSALLGCDIRIEFNPQAIGASGNITLADINFIPDAKPEAALGNASVSLDFNAAFDEKQSALTLKNTVLNINGIKVNADGSISAISSAPVLDMQINLPAQKISTIMSALPAAYAKKADSLQPSGNISAKATLKGKADRGAKLVQNASLDLDQVNIKSDGIPVALNGGLLLQSGTLKSRDLVINLKDSAINTDIRADNVFGKIITVKTAMNADTVDLDAILADKKTTPKSEPAAQAENKASGKNSGSSGTGKTKTGSSASEPAPLDIPVNASGTVSIALLKYHNVPARDVKLDYTFKNNKLHIQQHAAVAGGTIKKNVNLDLGVKGYRYDGDFSVSHALAQDILAYTAPSFKNAVSGILDLKGNFKGRGIQPKDIKKNIWLKGNWNILEGRLARTGIISALASFLNMDKEIKTIDFKNAYGDFLVEAGKILFNGKFSSDRINLAPEGSVSLDGDLDIRLNAVVSPELAAKIPAGKLLTPMRDHRGWSVLPLMVKGTWSSPAITLDTTAVKQQAIHTLTDRLLGQGKKTEENETSQQDSDAKTQKKPATKPAEQLLDNAIKGLFGN